VVGFPRNSTTILSNAPKSMERLLNSMHVVANLLCSITNYMSLISYASRTYADEDPEKSTEWSNAFRQLMISINPFSHEVVMLLSLLSFSVREGRPLPPYIPQPGPFSMSQTLESMDPGILSVRNINEPGYAAFAVLQLAARCISADLDNLTKTVKELVGVLDFSFRVEMSEAPEEPETPDKPQSYDDPETRKDK
jgi:hypothetical protein